MENKQTNIKLEDLKEYKVDPTEDVELFKKGEERVGEWHVSENGDMTYGDDEYVIEADRLHENDWILQMFTKGWVDWNEFIPAYYQALLNADIQYKTEKVYL